MNTLFPNEAIYPQGFCYLPDFISADEEASLLGFIQQITLNTFRFQGYEAKRRVASFGLDWSFEKQQLSQGKPIPKEFDWLIERVAKSVSLANDSFGELLVTEYPVGSVINWHRDAPPFGLIAGVSLNADCTFKLRPHAKEKQNRKATVSIQVTKRSLYVMQGEARTDWQHSILPVNNTRYSITLRTLR